MKLTKDCKKVLDAVIMLRPNNNGIYYTLAHVMTNSDLDMSQDALIGVLNTLAEAKAIRWGDEQHTAFGLNETGKEYKQLDRLEAIERWKERAIGFVGGLALAVITWLITGRPQL